MRFPKPLSLSLGFVVLLIGAAISSSGADSETNNPAWDLQRCLAEAEQASPLLAEARSRSDAAASGLEAERAGLYPVVGLNADASYINKTMKLTIPALPTMPAREMEFGDGSNADLMLGVQVPLYEGGALRARRDAADARWRAERYTVQADSLDLRLQIRRTFFAALGADAAAQAALRGETRLRRHLDDVEADRRAGAAGEEAGVLVRARLARQEQATVMAEAEAARLRLALGRLVGRPDEEIRPSAELDTSLLPTAETSVPWEERPALQVLDARIAAGEKDASAAAGSLRPSLDLQGGWHYGRPGIDAITNDWMDYGTVALGLRWTLFDFGRRSHRIDGLRAGNRALEHRREDTDRALRSRLATARVRREAAVDAEASAARRVGLQQRYLELVENRLNEGFATQREYLDAQDDVTLAEIDLATARANLRGSEAELLAALGH